MILHIIASCTLHLQLYMFTRVVHFNFIKKTNDVFITFPRQLGLLHLWTHWRHMHIPVLCYGNAFGLWYKQVANRKLICRPNTRQNNIICSCLSLYPDGWIVNCHGHFVIIISILWCGLWKFSGKLNIQSDNKIINPVCDFFIKWQPWHNEFFFY